MNDLGMKIHNARVSAGMTMQELGDKCGVKASAVNKWEKGIVTNIPIGTLDRISIALGVSISELYDSSNDNPINIIESKMRLLDEPSLQRIIKYAEYLISTHPVPSDDDMHKIFKDLM